MVVLIFSFQLPPKYAHCDSKTVIKFWKTPIKIQKRPLFIKKWKNSKNIFKAIRSSQIDFFLFFDPPKYAHCDSKKNFDFWKSPIKIHKRPLFHQKLEKLKKYFLKPQGVVELIFTFFSTPPNMPIVIPKQFSNFEKLQ